MVLFYRCVDSLSNSEGDQLRQIEERIFQGIVKQEVESVLGCWEGSDDQNVMADKKIASSIRSSFANYEKRRESHEESYFKF